MSSLFSASATEWLRRFLDIEEPAVPVRLETDLVTPIIDIAQKGWPHAAFRGATGVTPVGAISTVILMDDQTGGLLGQRTDTEQVILLGMSWTETGNTAGSIAWGVVPKGGTVANSARYHRRSVAALEEIGWTQLGGEMRGVIVPPRGQLWFVNSLGGLSAGELRCTWMAVPLGVLPPWL